MTFAQLKSAIQAAQAKGLPDTAVVTCNGSTLNDTFHIEMGKYLESGGTTESVETQPALQFVF